MEKMNFNPKTDCLDDLINLMQREEEGLIIDGPLPYYHCIFEKIYFESIESDFNIRFRNRLGRKLSLIPHPREEVVVIAVPDSGRSAATGYADEYHYKLKEGFKKRHDKRTFIAYEDIRQSLADAKYGVVPRAFKDKHVVLIDDSIVRGTTVSRLIIKSFECGAKGLYFKSSAPPVRYPCYAGIDMKQKTDFLAAERSVEEIHEVVFESCNDIINKKHEIGIYNNVESDYMLSKINKKHIDIEYVSLTDLIDVADSFYKEVKQRWCTGCFNGSIPILKGDQRLAFDN